MLYFHHEGRHMASQYSHMQFFRRIPNTQLASYFKSKNINLDVNFSELKERETEKIFQAFIGLPEEQQAAIEAELQDINAMACEGGVTTLIDEASFHGDDGFIKAISEIDGFHAKVMWAFLEKRSYWQGATMFLHADNVGGSFWKKRNDLPKVPPHVEDNDIKQLEKAISDFFHKSEGRGRNCKVEPYRRYNNEYFFAYPEDFGQSGVEWVSDSLKTRARHPAFEIIFVYTEEKGSLDIYAPKNSKAVPELQKLFAKTILKLETLKDGTIDKRVYDLEPLADPDFKFQIEPKDGIESIVVTRLRLTLKPGSGRRVILEADTKNNPQAVYDLLDQLNPPKHFITQITLKVTFVPTNGRRAKTRSFNISYPNSCALNYDGTDLLIRNMLAQSGIEPKSF